MMTAEILENLKRNAPYRVEIDSEKVFFFITDSNIEYTVDFMKDYTFSTFDAYQISLLNDNRLKSPRDWKLRDTVFAIIEAFFAMNDAAVIFICDTGDGRQALRNRLFTYWYATYENADKYALYPGRLKDEDGNMNYFGLLMRSTHPLLGQAYVEFRSTIEALSKE